MTQVTFQTTALATPPDGTNVDVNAGTNSDATQRVTIATDDALNTVLGTTADAASVSTSIKAALRAISTALGITALDLGSGTGGSRTLRVMQDTSQVPTLESSRVPVNIISGQAGVAAGSGSNGATVQRVTVATDDTLMASQGVVGSGTEATAQRVTLATNRLGTVLKKTPVLDTSIYANNEVLFIPIEITNAVHHASGSGTIRSFVIIDDDDQGVAIDIYFQEDNSTNGSLNAAFAPADGSAEAYSGRIQVLSSDWQDLGGVRVAFYDNLGIKVLGDSNGSIWMSGAVRSGTPTYTASGLKVKIGIDWD